MQQTKETDSLDHCLAYQTPPYDTKKQYEATSPSPRTSCIRSPELLIDQIAILLSSLTMNRCTTKIRNDSEVLGGFLREILKRSKCNKKVTLLSTLYFQKINNSQKDIDDLPEFAKCSKRAFLSCLILAHKFLNDNTFSLKTWSLISGLKQKDLSCMERWYLQKLDYKLFAAESELEDLEVRLFPKRRRSLDESLAEELVPHHRKIFKLAVINS
ncbi:hypothetical protein HG535_0C03220 [Zygotorulaspora mrakii]|uniref:Cyclin N-terminal domain-containing protein n=1 Tax=Zygotorulaspora mrakii TaxID=42260 RepID=A0A7H9B1W3_ZYGMR|nr:uncharacterized protein HG535_0C03220 [Zygotorulaspora mrakii]QLG71969.1 hypothetical protein HG535_0C03220 [Zygotorulaspora mrakii]